MITEEIVAALKAEHGPELHLLEHDGVEVVAVAPPAPEWLRFQNDISNEDRRAGALPNLARGCIVYVDGAASTKRDDVRKRLDAVAGAKTGILTTFANSLTKLAGLSKEATVKKL